MSEVATAHRTYEDVDRALKDAFGDGITDVVVNEHGGGQLVVYADANNRTRLLALLKETGFTFYCFCAGVDWPEADVMEVYDHVSTPSGDRRVTVKYSIPRSAPRIETATAVYRGADWHERETWELFGIAFAGHARLRRLLLPDWFEGFPLRKDYELPARVEKPWPGEFFEG